MLSESWVCQKCQRVGGFKCLGVGFVVCSGCGALHIVLPSGLLKLGRILKQYVE